jgi:hypothetical protein
MLKKTDAGSGGGSGAAINAGSGGGSGAAIIPQLIQKIR